MELSPEAISFLQMLVVILVAWILIRGLLKIGKKLVSFVLSIAVTVYILIQYGPSFVRLMTG